VKERDAGLYHHACRDSEAAGEREAGRGARERVVVSERRAGQAGMVGGEPVGV
jgi:hypothetical protein